MGTIFHFHKRCEHFHESHILYVREWSNLIIKLSNFSIETSKIFELHDMWTALH